MGGVILPQKLQPCCAHTAAAGLGKHGVVIQKRRGLPGLGHQHRIAHQGVVGSVQSQKVIAALLHSLADHGKGLQLGGGKIPCHVLLVDLLCLLQRNRLQVKLRCSHKLLWFLSAPGFSPGKILCIIRATPHALRRSGRSRVRYCLKNVIRVNRNKNRNKKGDPALWNGPISASL